MNVTSQSSVVLDNVDDYLAPSQACINPLFQPALEKPIKEKKEDVVVRRLRRVVRRPVVENDSSAEDKTESALSDTTKSPAVKASIADCLACSGCVTTAETVLLEQHHSLTSLRQRLNEKNGRNRVLTISPNSMADLCRHWGLSMSQMPRLVTLLHRVLQANVVVDGNIPLEWTWHEEAEEFVEQYRNRQSTIRMTPTTPPPSTAVDATRTMYYLPDGTSPTITHDPFSGDRSDLYATPTQLPLLSGSCPALVCLVEKSLHTLVPHLSTTLSPMTRMGLALLPWDHWAVMPCHDKKLEASRKDFAIETHKAVDLVITSMELVELIEEWRCMDTQSLPLSEFLPSLPEAKVWSPTKWSIDELEQQVKQNSILFWTNSSSSAESNTESKSSDPIAFNSGGHADYIFRHAALKLFGHVVSQVEWQPTTMTNGSTTIKSLRLVNLQKKQQSYQACLYHQDDGSYSQQKSLLSSSVSAAPVLRFGMVRGMQTMQRALKDLTSDMDLDMHYLEAMACPHGCVNGGGSVRQTTPTTMTKETPSETKARVDQTIQALIVPHSTNMSLESSGPHYHTRYHVVPPMHHTMGAAAGVKVQDMQW